MKKGSINTSTGAHLSDIDPDETKDLFEDQQQSLD